jgi:hypothetical protein
MTDLTKITTPFGLLDPETKEALRAHGLVSVAREDIRALPMPADLGGDND